MDENVYGIATVLAHPVTIMQRDSGHVISCIAVEGVRSPIYEA